MVKGDSKRQSSTPQDSLFPVPFSDQKAILRGDWWRSYSRGVSLRRTLLEWSNAQKHLVVAFCSRSQFSSWKFHGRCHHGDSNQIDCLTTSGVTVTLKICCILWSAPKELLRSWLPNSWARIIPRQPQLRKVLLWSSWQAYTLSPKCSMYIMYGIFTYQNWVILKVNELVNLPYQSVPYMECLAHERRSSDFARSSLDTSWDHGHLRLGMLGIKLQIHAADDHQPKNACRSRFIPTLWGWRSLFISLRITNFSSKSWKTKHVDVVDRSLRIT